MQLSKRKTIGIFISRSSAEYQCNFLQEFIRKATENGYYTLVYTTFGTYGPNEGFATGERYVAEIPEYESLDGIILAIDTFEEPILEQTIIENTRKRAKCPVVCVRRAVEGFHNILVDDKNAMEGILLHLIEHHGFRDFCFVNGPKDHPDAINRLACYERVLKEKGIPIQLDSVVNGDFWKNKGEEMVEYLLEGREKLPEVIVCANDYMAVSVSNALRDRKIRVPEEVAVTGFDDVSEAAACVPSLTTVRVDTVKMADRAFEVFEQLKRGQTVAMTEYIQTEVVLRESCGCEERNSERLERSIRTYFDMANMYNKYNHQTAFMSIDGENSDDLDSMNQVIYKYIFNNSHFRDFFLAFCDYDWEHQDSDCFTGFTKRMHLRTVIQNNMLLGHIDHVFDKGDVLPEEYCCEEPCGYFVMPLHYQDRCFGYTMINFWVNAVVEPFYQFMIIEIGTTFENLRIRKKMGALIEDLQNLYVTDVLTGLLNRHGFEEQSQRMYDLAVEQSRSLVIFGIDMDGLKTVNDTFGHGNGDTALCAIANAIVSAGFTEERCCRVGGDEFNVLALDYTEEMVESYMGRLNGFLDDYNSRSKRPYIVQVSIGYALCDPAESKSLQEWLTLSDDSMYHHKESRREGRKIIRGDQ